MAFFTSRIARIRTSSFLFHFYLLLCLLMIQWKPDCRQWEQKQKNRPIEMLVTMRCDWFISSSASAVLPMKCTKISNKLACVASVSARVCRESWEESKKKKKEWRGRGRGKKETLACKPHNFEKLCLGANWRGAGSVDYLALKTSIKPGMLCLRASQIWSHLICGRRLQMLWTDIYLNRVCAKVYEIRVFKV